MAVVTTHNDFGAQENKVSHCFHFSPSICHEVLGPDAMIFIFLNIVLKSICWLWYKPIILRGKKHLLKLRCISTVTVFDYCLPLTCLSDLTTRSRKRNRAYEHACVFECVCEYGKMRKNVCQWDGMVRAKERGRKERKEREQECMSFQRNPWKHSKLKLR